MEPINPKLEKKVLKELHRLLVDDNREMDLVNTYKMRTGFLLFVPAVLLGVVAGCYEDFGMSPEGVLIISAFLGFLVGLSVLFRASMQQIPIFKQHLNQESIEARLNELGESNFQ